MCIEEQVVWNKPDIFKVNWKNIMGITNLWIRFRKLISQIQIINWLC